MRSIHSFDTSLEVRFRKALWQAGLRYRLHPSNVPGTPDLAIRKIRVAVFIDGCFWHGCPFHFVPPHTRTEFWVLKIRRNRERRQEVRRELSKQGWKIVELWEHQIRRAPKASLRRVLHAAGMV